MMEKKLGFGCMRLPMSGEEVNSVEFSEMIDEFLGEGFCYFDTAHGYINGKSETAIRECLVKRHPRESFILANKLSNTFFKKEGGIRPLFEQQLKACGTDYFDYYLMHGMCSLFYEKYRKCNAFETCLKLKEEGKIRHLGISFHDKPEILDKILSDYPEIEMVQIQLNYLDFLSESIQSKKCYDVCVKHGKQVFVMEPVKGGSLTNLPDEAEFLVRQAGISKAELAIRFAAGFDNVSMVLSGMSSINQMKENIGFMKNFVPLDKREIELTERITEIINAKNQISCTGCGYCLSQCPKKIQIPNVFACFNNMNLHKEWHDKWYYDYVYTVDGHSKASECLKCGNCEKVCPQHLSIRELLETVSSSFENV